MHKRKIFIKIKISREEMLCVLVLISIHGDTIVIHISGSDVLVTRKYTSTKSKPRLVWRKKPPKRPRK